MLSFKNKSNLNHPLIFAHRGASSHAFENTIEAFDKAIEMRCDGIELDIRKTKDNVLIVYHDPALKHPRRSIKKMRYKEIQKRNDLSEYKIPTFEETCKHLAGKIALDIELKETGYEQLVIETALKYFSKEHLLFTSFKKKSLYSIKEIDDSLLCGYLISPKNRIYFKNIDRFDYLLPHYSLCTKRFLDKLRKIGKPIIVWTLDNSERGYKLFEQGICGIITNDPQIYR
ncbi:MAG: glycerophosphodiester phosphodiesterase [Calditrichaeota bacterium]|nr:MAG: glycerophosphodiester phosphodiesterase [Calditrichota bacterium]